MEKHLMHLINLLTESELFTEASLEVIDDVEAERNSKFRWQFDQKLDCSAQIKDLCLFQIIESKAIVSSRKNYFCWFL